MPGLVGHARSMPADGGVGWSDPSAIPPNSAFSRQLAGVVVNEHTALQIMTVMACVRLISGVVGGMPLRAYVNGQAGGGKTQLDPAPPIVAQPFGPGLSTAEGIEMGVISLMLMGNAYYLVADRDSRGTPILLLPIPTQSVKVQMVRGAATYKVNSTPVDPKDIVHIRWVTLPGGVTGLAPIEYAAQGLGLTLAAEEFGARFFAQGATAAGVLQSDEEISAGTARRIAHDFAHKHGGLAQAHLPLVLDSGLKWSPIQVPPDQAQFLATRQFHRQEIEGFFGVPPHLVGDVDATTSWGSGIQDQKMDFLTFTISKYLTRFEDAWNRMLNGGGVGPQYVKFGTEQLLRMNTIDRYNGYLVARSGAWMTSEEIRAAEDMPPADDPALSDFAQQFNTMPKPAPNSSGASTGGDEKAL